jgi:hypothetical protein
MSSDSQPSPLPDTGAGGPPGNLILNGDFSQGGNFWSIVSGTGTPTANNGALCVFVGAQTYAILGWPEPQGTLGPPLTPGAMYTFSYMAQATPAVAIDAKVGHSMSPFTADYETPAGVGDAVPASFMMFSHTFMAPTSPAETSVGIAFQIPASGSTTSVEQVCFKNVSLAPM